MTRRDVRVAAVSAVAAIAAAGAGLFVLAAAVLKLFY